MTMTMTKRVHLAALCFLLGVAASEARADAPVAEFTPFGGYRLGGEFEVEDPAGGDGETVDLDDAGSFGLDLGIYRDPASFYELLYSRQSAGLDGGGPELAPVDLTTEYIHFGGTLLFEQDRGPDLYLSMTIGATRFDAEGGRYDSKSRFSGSLGGGLRMPFGEHFAATAGVRGYLTLVDSNTDILCISGGGEGGCLLKSSGSTFFQAEAQLGLTFVF